MQACGLAIALPLLGVSLGTLAADDEWLAVGEGAAVRQTGESVTFDYQVKPGRLSMAVLRSGGGRLAGMAHLRFRLRTDVSTVVAVVLSEKKPGGDYATKFWSPRGRWQQIDLTPADFALNDGPKDPEDPDGRLDMDAVEHIAVLDLGQLFSQMAEGRQPFAVTRLSGAHELGLEALQIVTERGKGEEAGVVIDDFRREFLTWFTPGGAELEPSKSGNPLGKPAMEFRYGAEPAKMAVVMHGLGQTSLRGASKLSFDVASTRDAHLLITLEERKVDGHGGPRYNLDFTIGAGQTGHMEMPFSEFRPAEGGPADAAGRLDPAKVETIGLVDVSGIVDGSREHNTLWVADMRAE